MTDIARSFLPRARAIGRVALIGNALPRRCGLATFTSHVADALGQRFPELAVDHYAIDDGTGVTYPDGVATIAMYDPAAYRAAAGRIQAAGTDVIFLQHEFGIFGGEAGEMIFDLIGRTSLPVVSMLHTVLEAPSAAEERVFRRLLDRSARLIVMAERGRTLLRTRYGVDDARIAVIPHGVPDRSWRSPEIAKPAFGTEDRTVVMTFGLLAPDKGVQYMIEALPALVEAHPTLLYQIVGATHPNLVRHEGEAYRERLVALAESLGVSAHVEFVNAFLEQDELLDRLQAADLYVTPYLNMQQVTSGALSYAVAVGKAVVSTPYLHAQEILDDGHGVFVPARDPAALAKAVGALLSDPARRAELAARAYARGRSMIWSRFAERAMEAFAAAAQADAGLRPAQADARRLLPLSLEGVERMSDGTGMLQHAIYSVPDRNHGYCIDDNARALILMCTADTLPRDRRLKLAGTYAAFIEHGWNPDRGRFRNFMAFDRSWCEAVGSDDSNGRALWALGVAAASAPSQALRGWAQHLFDRAAPLAEALDSPRTLAFCALAGEAMLAAHPSHDRARAMLARAGDTLSGLLACASRPGWCWFESVLAYDNARLPQALIAAGRALGRRDWLDPGLEALAWLCAVQTDASGHFQAVGTDSFGRPYAPPLPFDQQPLEAQATVEACAAAERLTAGAEAERWSAEAWRAYRWFSGANALGLPVATPGDGGCHDGLMPGGVNANQGAESILALQLASVAISGLSSAVAPAKKTRDVA